MPKRRNPFGDITPLQRKKHVGFEQMATQEERQGVYKKTKALLFRGANPTSSPAFAHTEHHNRGLTFPNGCAVQTRQQVLTCNGQATVSATQQLSGHYRTLNGGEVVCAAGDSVTGDRVTVGNGVAERRCQPGLLNYFSSSHTSSRGSVPGGKVCGRESGGDGVRRMCSVCRQQCGVCTCEHCETAVCLDCSRHCYHCQLTFCSSCSVLNYDEVTLRSFCLNCLSS